MLKRPYYIVLTVLVMTLVVLNLPARTTTRIKLALGSLFLPLFGLNNTTHDLVEKAGKAVLPRADLEKENESLRQENQRLRMQLQQADEIARENGRLRELVGWKQQKRWNLKLARVISFDPANWWRTVQIDCGSRDGLRVDMPVLTPDGLVGKISMVSLTRSQVVLLGDPGCKVATVVQNSARDLGIVTGNSPFDRSIVNFDCFSKDPNLKPGQTVVTSGQGGVFPGGITVGTIADSRQVEFGLYTEARVKVSAKLGTLEEVWVWMQ